MADEVTSGVSETMAAMQARVQRMEDHWEILQVIAAYGAAVDAGLADVVADLWTEDGVYDVDGQWVMRGREEIAAMVHSRHHQGLIASGCGHVMGLPVITVEGDTAVARHHSQLVAYAHNGFEVQRVTAHRWLFVRTPTGWKASHRRCHVLDGADVARDLLAGRWTPQEQA